jgi:hypothetical protein
VKKSFFIFLGIMMCSFSAVFSQGEIDQQEKVFYRNEWSLALMINSTGFGANYRYGERINAADKRLYEIDFAYVKDPKETKSDTQSQFSTARYVYGKTNLAFDFRIGYGKQHERFRKHDAGGIAIRSFYNFGPSIMLLKPIYYEIEEAVGTGYEPRPPSKYNSQWTNVNIISRASFFKGFNEIKVVPGVFAKFGYNFEFGKEDRIIHALEAGIIAEGFIKKIEIMDFSNPDVSQRDSAKNQQFFITLFLSYRFGRIVDPYEVKKKRERSKEISY